MLKVWLHVKMIGSWRSGEIQTTGWDVLRKGSDGTRGLRDRRVRWLIFHDMELRKKRSWNVYSSGGESAALIFKELQLCNLCCWKGSCWTPFMENGPHNKLHLLILDENVAEGVWKSKILLLLFVSARRTRNITRLLPLAMQYSHGEAWSRV